MPSSHEQIVEEVQNALIEFGGFAQEAVIRDYEYADYFESPQEIRTVALAAFAETPPSYLSARLALARMDDDAPRAERLDPLRALGAPLVITLGPRKAAVWNFASGYPTQTNAYSRDRIGHVIRTCPADWTPAAASRLNLVKRPGPRQLDFSDLGLIPAIEEQVNQKLDHLIREVLAGLVPEDKKPPGRRDYYHRVRLLFWLLTAKVLDDKRHPGISRSPNTATQALALARRHYGSIAEEDHGTSPHWNLRPEIVDWAWDRIRRGFHFQNLSVDSLAFVYENTLVSPEVRRRLGIHGTPKAIAEKIVELLPIDELPPENDTIVELCSGFGPFLLAALRRLRQGPLFGLDPRTRHNELVRRLKGVELDPFAIEVARLCMTLADYPSADGWQLKNDDVFLPGVIQASCRSAGTVLSNPPFEAFSPEERQRYGPSQSEKPIELLRIILEVCKPLQLGVVVPRTVLESERPGYRKIREDIRHHYREIDRIDLPDSVFDYSDAETVLLIARGRRPGKSTVLRSDRVLSTHVSGLLRGTWTPEWKVAVLDKQPAQLSSAIRVDEYAEVWERLAEMPRLRDIATMHRGIEYRRSLNDELISVEKRRGMVPGLHLAGDIQPYRIRHSVYLNVAASEIRLGGGRPWSQPKVVANASRRRRGLWCITAAPDLLGHWCYQNLSCIWPIDVESWPLEVISAVLNGPIAALFAASRSDKRHIHLDTLSLIPFPDRSLLQISLIRELVAHAARAPDAEIVLRIDAEILRGYDLPPRLERSVLVQFEGEDRPGVSNFTGFYPSGFASALPLHQVLSQLVEKHRASKLLSTVPILNSDRVSDLFRQIAEDYGE